jgi:hypothetical protein
MKPRGATVDPDAADALGTLWLLAQRARGPQAHVFWANVAGAGAFGGHLFVLSMGGGGYTNVLGQAVLALRDRGTLRYLGSPGPVGVFRFTEQAQEDIALARGLGC